METYKYSGYYNDIKVEGQLGTEGILVGSYGDLHFRRCEDGLSIINSSFLGSGFVAWPTSADIGFPSFINDIPVTEIHQCISISNTYPIAIESPNLKRAYLRITKTSVDDQIKEAGSSLAAVLLIMLRDQENVNQKDKFLEVSVDFFKSDNSIEYCEIESDQRCLLHGIAAKQLIVKAPTVVLKGHAYSKLERAVFSGKVYPYVYSDWDGDVSNNDFFAGTSHLKLVDGSLRGDDCWCFNDCTSLEKVHLANGIIRVPPYSFKNCSSLADLYIPDTVSEIGEYAFLGCTNLKTIHLPNGIKMISKGMFMDCKSLTKCFLSDDIEIIEDEAFKGCISMKRPWIPKKIRIISENAFDNPEWSKF